MTEHKPSRYGVYFAPALGSDWWVAGSHWLGRSANDGLLHPQPPADGLSMQMMSVLTAAPRRYGWHATLKAPFALAQGVSLQQLRLKLESLAAGLKCVSIPKLRVQRVDDFLALVPEGHTAAIDQIAAACVTGLHSLAAPLSETELQRRRQAPLSTTENAMLLAWGYPYVLENFRFHMSITGSLRERAPWEIAALLDAAKSHFHPLPVCRMDHLTLFVEPTPGADFVVLEQFPMSL
jgi:putative phosphonate metabolism protein